MDLTLINIAISSAGTVGALLAAAFAGKMLLNDNMRMRRRPPTLELGETYNYDKPAGWQTTFIVIRNHEPIAVKVKGVRAIRRKCCISANHGPIDGFGNMQAPDSIPEMKYAEMPVTIAPAGTPNRKFAHGDSASLRVFTQNVASASDLKLEWEWADGQKR